MGNILLISERPKAFGDLVHQLEKIKFSVFVRSYNVFVQKKHTETIVDLVLYELSLSDNDNIRNIGFINKYGTIPIYVFGDKISCEEVAYYDAGATGVVRMPFQAPTVAARLKSVMLLLEKDK